MKAMLLSTAFAFFTVAVGAGIAGAQPGNAMMGPGMMGPGMGMMQGGGMMGGNMMGPGMMRGGMMGPGMMQGGMMGPAPRLSPEERLKVAAANADFWKKTEDLRGDIYRKRLEMQIEMSKKSPDEATLMKLEDELLALQGKVAKLRIKHRLALKAINPRLGMMGSGMMQGRGMRGGGMMGPGMMQGRGMMGGCMKNRGMMGGGTMGMGRAPGMMQGGMMGPGMMQGRGMMGGGMMGPGMMQGGMMGGQGMGRGPGMMRGGMLPANPAAGASTSATPTTPPAESTGTATQ